MIVLILVTKEIEICFDDWLFFITDVNECNNMTYPLCHAKATCNNTVGSYICDCHQGYDGNGTNCTGMHLISCMFVPKPYLTIEMTRKINIILQEGVCLLLQQNR